MTTHTPLRCAYSAMTNDPIAAKIILLNTGNYPSYSSYLNESWTFSSGDWTNVSPTLVDAGGPLPGRTDHVMAFDGSNVILFGGHDSIGQMLQDTWLWNGLTWAKQSPVTSPFGRYRAQASYLPGTGMVMFGGENLGNLLNETWIWNGSNWSQVSHANTTTASPSGRTGHVMASNAPGAPLSLGAATSFAILGASTVTNTGNTVITGDLGLYPGTSITGFPPGTVSGTIHDTDAAAQAAQAAALATFTAGNALPGGVTLPGDIGGTTVTPGVYKSASSLGITGTVVLDGGGNPNASWIFQIGSTLTTAAGNSVVSLINGANAANIFWLVGSSATLGTNTTFNGTIIAQASVTATTGANVTGGRLIALTGAVTLDTNHVTVSLSPGPSSIQTILFGGRGNKYQSNTTWSFNGTAWTQLSPATSPSIRSEGCMAFDSANGKWVMFGGQNEYGYLNETWTFDGTNWTQVAMANGVGPAGRVGAQMAYDAGSSRTIMYGGISAGTNYPSNETWSFNGSSGVWTRL
jgi:hypothetical protein